MENVGVDLTGAVISAGVAATAWAAGQLNNLGQTVVTAAVDAFESLQPQPYEEWLNAPPAVSDGTPEEFRNPANETTPTTSPAVLISEAGVQETVTGVSSPPGPGPDYEVAPIPISNQNQDPQKPIAPGFTDIPEALPTATVDSNVVMDLRITDPLFYPQGDATNFQSKSVFRGARSSGASVTWNQAVFSAVPVFGEDGLRWTARTQLFFGGRRVQTWNVDAGERPPTSGDFDVIYGNAEFGYESQLRLPYAPGSRFVKRYSLKQPAAPPLNPPAPTTELPLTESAVPVSSSSWSDVPVASTSAEPFVDLPLAGTTTALPATTVSVPTVPPAVVPIPVNNPISVPAIGTNGLPLPAAGSVASTPTDVHVVEGTPVSSGGARPSLASIAAELGRVESKAARLMNNTSNGPPNDFNWLLLWQAINEIYDWLASLTNQLPGGSFTLTAPCDYTENGDNKSYFFAFPKADFQTRVLDQQLAILDVLQYHLNSKTPICRDDKPQLQGTWVSTRWESDSPSPGGRVRLRKLLRYRSKSTRDASELETYWREVVWQAGPVCVFHKGAWWGTPQIWASTEEEGKRVLRIAGGEAGIDPDQIGEWGTSSSRSARYGMPGTMRLMERHGSRWVTRRDGPDGLPELP